MVSYDLLALLVASAAASPLQTSGSRIVGGYQVAEAEFPYVVSLQSGPYGHECGGFLLNATAIVTAGHCSMYALADPTEYNVRLGSNIWFYGGTLVNVSSVVRHPLYSFFNNDVAVWHLSTPIRESNTIAYANLTSPGNDPEVGSILTIMGWGRLDETVDALPRLMYKTSLPVIDRGDCLIRYENSSVITENLICAATNEGGQSACYGDSGGPVVDEHGQVVGLVGGGRTCGGPGDPNLYARVGNYIDWIKNN